MPSNSRRHLTQPALTTQTSVVTNDLPSPQPLRELSPGDGTCDTVRPPRQWQLHSAVLTRNSPWFARSIREQQAASKTADWLLFALEKINDRFVLVAQNPEGDRPISRKPDSDETLLKECQSKCISQRAKTKIIQDDIVVYEQVFGSFYNIAPRIEATNVKTATSQAKALVKIAQDLGCIHLISSHVGNALLQHRQSLYKAILDDPPRYLLLASALENEFIYAESLIHLIGAHPCWPWPTKQSALPDTIRQLIVKKSRELDMQVLETERELLLLTITTKRGIPYSAESHSQFDTWFVVQMFRDTLTNVFRQHDASKPSLKRGNLFRKIRADGSTYMAYEDVRRMVQAVMPSAVETLGEDLRILKEFASEIVENLARNELSLDVEENKVGWLTCAKVEKEYIPWRAGER
ncbi:hypothetical protein ST47_g9423 [Ascochyta rabiei]|uniref:BTB domain-containing protein n=1 Tax=Didymella rabiei TaxID=5454 RepID=A0A162XF05_DIDRA|nr:hypothetical protein ST47_g9423 [Ascochyta rabiei]